MSAWENDITQPLFELIDNGLFRSEGRLPGQESLQRVRRHGGRYLFQGRAEVRRLLGATEPFQTVQMWARFGFAPPVEPAPRRGLEAHLL